MKEKVAFIYREFRCAHHNSSVLGFICCCFMDMKEIGEVRWSHRKDIFSLLYVELFSGIILVKDMKLGNLPSILGRNDIKPFLSLF